MSNKKIFRPVRCRKPTQSNAEHKPSTTIAAEAEVHVFEGGAQSACEMAHGSYLALMDNLFSDPRFCLLAETGSHCLATIVGTHHNVPKEQTW